MASEIKKYEDEYKKIVRKSKDFTVQRITKLEKRLHYFRHDVIQGYDALEQAVGEAKGNNIEHKKITGYAKESKDIAMILKHIDHCKAKQEAALVKIKDLENRAFPTELGLSVLARTITSDFGKGSKLSPDIKKLQKQIDTNLNEIKAFLVQVKKIPAKNRDPSKDYDVYIKRALTAKPRKSKYNKTADQMFDKKTLKKLNDECDKALKAINEGAKDAEKYAKAGNIKERDNHLLFCQNAIKDIIEIEEVYSKFHKNNKSNIKDDNTKKEINDAVNQFVKIRKEAEKKVEATEALIKKLS